MRNLIAYRITGSTFNWTTHTYDEYVNVVGIDVQSWSNSQLNDLPFKLIFSGDTIPSNYSNITNIINLDKFGFNYTNDYCIIRYEIDVIRQISGWTNLSNNEKDICIKYLIYDELDAVTHLMTVSGFTEFQSKTYLENMWKKHNILLIDSHNKRWFSIKECFIKYLGMDNANILVDNLNHILFAYLTIGRIGKNYYDSVDGIMDYIESTNGFIGNGLTECGYMLQYGMYPQFVNELKNIIIFGIY